MSISIKTPEEIEKMRVAGRLASEVLDYIEPFVKAGVTTIYNNDYDDSAKMGKGSDNPYVESRFGLVVDGKGSKGRYVRLYSNGNTSNEMNHYIEVEVFGKAG